MDMPHRLAGIVLKANLPGGPDVSAREEVIPIQVLRATAVVLPFVGLAILVQVLSLVIAAGH